MSFKARFGLHLVALCIFVACSSPSETKQHSPNETLIDNALIALERIIGSEISNKNTVWLREQWADNLKQNPTASRESFLTFAR